MGTKHRNKENNGEKREQEREQKGQAAKDQCMDQKLSYTPGKPGGYKMEVEQEQKKMKKERLANNERSHSLFIHHPFFATSKKKG